MKGVVICWQTNRRGVPTAGRWGLTGIGRGPSWRRARKGVWQECNMKRAIFWQPAWLCPEALEDSADLPSRPARLLFVSPPCMQGGRPGANDAMAHVNGRHGHAGRDGMDLFSGMMPPPFATKVERMRPYKRPALSFASISGPRDVSGTPDTAVSSASAFRLASMNRT